MFRNIAAPYHILESWLYDRAVAPAVTEMIEERPLLLGPALDAMPGKGRLLDVGCGGGHMAIALAKEHPEWRITGIDQSPDQVRRAEERARPMADLLQFVSGSALALPFGADTFDGLISICSIKHWGDPIRGLNECLRVLRPGAFLVVIEVEPGHRPEDRKAFIARQHVPRCFRPIAMTGFRWKIASRSLSLHHTESLFRTMPVSDITGKTIPGMPMWIIAAKKDRS